MRDRQQERINRKTRLALASRVRSAGLFLFSAQKGNTLFEIVNITYRHIERISPALTADDLLIWFDGYERGRNA